MHFHKKYLFLLAVCLSLLALQSVWVFHAYNMERRYIIAEIKDAFDLAYQKEQTYRVPVVDIVNPGELTIQSCGKEEILIIRKCAEPDTIVYNNISGHSIENFIGHVFHDLREQITPMNIYCLSDLFAGMLYDRNIPVSFIVERFNIETGAVLEKSPFLSEEQPEIKNGFSIVSEISEKEAIRAILRITPFAVLGNMIVTLVFTICLVIIILICTILLFRNWQEKQDLDKIQPVKPQEYIQDNIFQIGQYCFDPAKNELQGFNEIIQLNKKENSILYALCANCGNVVERTTLLEDNWGSSGIIYSRSLDTYLATLRKYLKKDSSIQIITVKGVGYKLVC